MQSFFPTRNNTYVLQLSDTKLALPEYNKMKYKTIISNISNKQKIPLSLDIILESILDKITLNLNIEFDISDELKIIDIYPTTLSYNESILKRQTSSFMENKLIKHDLTSFDMKSHIKFEKNQMISNNIVNVINDQSSPITLTLYYHFGHIDLSINYSIFIKIINNVIHIIKIVVYPVSLSLQSS